MGSGGAKAHESFSIAPAPAAAAPVDPGTAAVVQASAADDVAIAGYNAAAAAGISAINNAGTFQEMLAAVGSASAALPHSDMPQLSAEANDAIHAASKEWLTGKSKEELEALAIEAGLQHPEMVSHKALAFWLDPSYPNAIEQKSKIAAKAVERYDQAVADGKIIPKPELPEGAWLATPEEAGKAYKEVLSAAEKLQGGYSWKQSEDLLELVNAENNYAAAYCPELGKSLDETKAQAKKIVTEKLGATGEIYKHDAVRKLIENGDIPKEMGLLDGSTAIEMMRASTPQSIKDDIGKIIEARKPIHAEYLGAIDSLSNLTVGEGWYNKKCKDPFTKDDVLAYHSAAATYLKRQKEIQDWGASNPELSWLVQDQAAKIFRQGAKALPITDLRASAEEMGMPETKGASRAQLQNWMIGQWHTQIDPADIAAEIAAKKNKPVMPAVSKAAAAGAPASIAPASPAASAAGGSGTVVSLPKTAGSGAWLAKQKQTIAALKHHAASLSDMPERPAAADVSGWAFAEGPSMSLGGAHAKSVKTAPDGSLWMFKPSEGHRAVSEAGANGILHRVGIPTVPVYKHKVDGKTGTVQPLMKGASNFNADPSKWSQGDVDAIVRYHAAAWVVGDHDAKHDNLLRTPSGGLVPIDHGQAFKFWGRDKLSTEYHPNSSYGAQPPVWNVLYEAAKTGKLAKGVEVRPAAAAPVIKAFESIPDSDYSGMLAPIAKAGASSSNSHWKETMQKRAAKKFGVSSPDAKQIAETFIDYGVERKNGVRQAFMKFFTDSGFAGADIITKAA